MNFVDPSNNPNTANIRASMHDWSLLGPANHTTDHSKEEILKRSEPIIRAMSEYKQSFDNDFCPNWQDRLAFDMAVLKFDTEVHKFHSEASENEQINQAIFSIEGKIRQARLTPLIDRFKQFQAKKCDSENVNQLVRRAQPVLEMLNTYIEKEFYPSLESKNAWKVSEYYDSSSQDGWFTAQLEERTEDRHMVHSIKGSISAISARLHNTLTDDDERVLRDISIEIIQKCKLL